MRDLITLSEEGSYKFYRTREHTYGPLAFYDINGFSSENEYIPFLALKSNLGIYGKKIIHYSITSKNGNNYNTSYSKLYHSLKRNTLPSSFKTKSMETPLKSMRGLLFEELPDNRINILFLIAVKTEKIKKVLKEDGINDMSNFTIFISKEFYTSSKYKSIHAKFQRDIIVPLIKEGVELVVTKNIESKCFKINIEKLKFKSVDIMKEHLHSFNQEIW